MSKTPRRRQGQGSGGGARGAVLKPRLATGRQGSASAESRGRGY